jgi:Phage capsid protein
MSVTVSVAHVHAYTREIQRQTAQRVSKLRSAVRVKSDVQGKTYNFERLGPSDLGVITRHSPTPLLNPEHSRRRASMADRGGGILLDKQDEVKMLIMPDNDYASNHADAINRFYDDLVIAAATGNSTAVAADDSTSSVALPAAQIIVNGGTGMTFAKVNQALRILNQRDAPYEDRTAVISPVGLEDLLATTQATSSDFADLKAIQAGKLQGTWMSFNWVVSTRLAITGNIRSALFFQKNALGLAIALDMYTSVSTRNDMNDATQVYAAATAGAVRIEEELLVQVDFDESV